jgi:hypothetical protein
MDDVHYAYWREMMGDEKDMGPSDEIVWGAKAIGQVSYTDRKEHEIILFSPRHATHPAARARLD